MLKIKTTTLLPSFRPSVLPSFRSFVLLFSRPSVLPFFRPSVLPSVRPSIFPSFLPSVLPSFRSSVLPSFRPSVRSFFRPFVRPSGRSSVRSSVHPSVRLSVLPSFGKLIIKHICCLHFQSRRVRLSPEQASEFYAEHSGKINFADLIKYISSGDMIAMLLARENGLPYWLEMMGPQNTFRAKETHPDRFVKIPCCFR